MKVYLELNALSTLFVTYCRQMPDTQNFFLLKPFDEIHVNLQCFFNPHIFPSESIVFY